MLITGARNGTPTVYFVTAHHEIMDALGVWDFKWQKVIDMYDYKSYEEILTDLDSFFTADNNEELARAIFDKLDKLEVNDED